MRAALIALGLLIASQMALAQSCRTPLASANRMLLVVPRSMNSTVAFVQRFSRPFAAGAVAAGRWAVYSVARRGNMWRVRQYRQWLLFDYPTDRALRAGWCIFIHPWLKGAKGTHGCVAPPPKRLTMMQNFAQGGAVLAAVPKRALSRFKGCLPALRWR